MDAKQTPIHTDAVWYPLSQHHTLQQSPPTKIVKGEGAYLTDSDGNTYLDAIAGVWCVNVGYGREELAKVAYEQMVNLAYLNPTMSHDAGIQLSQKLLQLIGFDGHVYFSASGSEANELAFKIARQYHMQAGTEGGANRQKIISRYRAYHGNTMGALSATGQAERKIGYGLSMPGFIHIPPPYPYRRHPNLSPTEHGLQVAQVLEDTIIYEGYQTVAAFIMEPMISGGGVLIPPDEYLPAVREICDKYNVLLIFDEVVSGFGRTGKMFGHQHWNIQPDILTCAKGIASGYMPISATAVREDIFAAFLGKPGSLNHLRQINTYGGHPVACAVALQNIDIIEREKLVENSAQVGGYLLAQLKMLADHPNVGEVRGKGLLLGIELVEDKVTKVPLDPARVSQIIGICKEKGVLIGKNGNTIPGLANVLVMSPPLILTQAEADRIVETIDSALKIVSLNKID